MSSGPFIPRAYTRVRFHFSARVWRSFALAVLARQWQGPGLFFMSAVLVPLLAKLFAVLAAGALLRARLPTRTRPFLHRLILDVAMPALLLLVLSRVRVDPAVLIATVPVSLAQLAVGALALALARGFKLARPTQGSAAMTTAFANTGFLGYPVVLALWGTDATASTTAIAIDSVCTTAWMWSFGVVLAARFGGGRAFSVGRLVRALVRPLTLSIVVGLALSVAEVRVPAELDVLMEGLIEGLGVLVSVLVFFALGLSLDLGALRGRALPVATMSVLKLLVMPGLVLLLVRALGLPATIATVAVLQAAMPSAMVSVLLSAEEGCDPTFAAGVAALTTLACIVTLPGVSWLMEQWPA